MNELQEELIKEGLAGLRQLQSGKHLRPQELAVTIVVVATNTEAAEEILLNTGRQARWEVANG